MSHLAPLVTDRGRHDCYCLEISSLQIQYADYETYRYRMGIQPCPSDINPCFADTNLSNMFIEVRRS